MQYMIVVLTMLNNSGQFPDPTFGSGGLYNSREACMGRLLHRKGEHHTLKKNNRGEYVLYGSDGTYIWIESCVAVIG